MLNLTYQLRATSKKCQQKERVHRKESYGEHCDRKEAECAEQKKNIKEPKRLTSYINPAKVKAFLLKITDCIM